MTEFVGDAAYQLQVFKDADTGLYGVWDIHSDVEVHDARYASADEADDALNDIAGDRYDASTYE